MPRLKPEQLSEMKTTKRKYDPTDALLRVAGKYVDYHGGRCIVSGPIQIVSWPTDRKHEFSLAIKMTGRPPKKEYKK